jgi:hypothetical protein
MGDAINMAARLMCLPEAHNGMLCDERTYNLCAPFFSFESMGETYVKGKSTAISVFRPVTAIADAELHKKAVNEPSVLIGRSVERQAIEQTVSSLGDPLANCLSFEADGGQGLSSLSQHVIDRLEAKKYPYWY